MKPMLFLVGALALAAAPALTQTSDPSPAPNPAPSDYRQFNSFENSPYVGTSGFRHCIAGGVVSGVQRAGARGVYVQSKRGRILRLDLAERCDALDGAGLVSLRAPGLEVCAGGSAVIKVKTAAGARFCAVRDITKPTKTEMASLAWR